jgi:hypothetical protein
MVQKWHLFVTETAVAIASSWTLVRAEVPKVTAWFKLLTASIALVFMDMTFMTLERLTSASLIQDMGTPPRG